MKFGNVLIFVALCVVAVGCDSPKTVWHTESRSPDGRYVAIAHTDERNAITDAQLSGTIVELKWTSGSQQPQEVLVFEDGATDSAGARQVGMEWRSPTHLEVTYSGKRNLVFQVVKCRGVDISVREVPVTANSTE